MILGLALFFIFVTSVPFVANHLCSELTPQIRG